MLRTQHFMFLYILHHFNTAPQHSLFTTLLCQCFQSMQWIEAFPAETSTADHTSSKATVTSPTQLRRWWVCKDYHISPTSCACRVPANSCNKVNARSHHLSDRCSNGHHGNWSNNCADWLLHF